jgi:ATP-dependent Clp protease protease subunit
LFFLIPPKERVVIVSFTDLGFVDSLFFFGKSEFSCRAVCNAQAMPVRLFNSIIILYYIIRVMIHQPIAAFYEAQIGEFVLEAEELLKLREILTRVYAQRTGKPLWVVSEDMERDVFMSAAEAQVHGIVDLVAVA